MKKTFKVFALMLLTAFAFSSCVDVPAPFNLPDKSSSTSGDGGSSSNEGTPVTCAQAVELANALADGATSSEVYTITGYITEVIGDVSRNQQTFWMADTKDGGRVFEAYWANLPDGVTAFTAGTKVKITGKLMKYVNANTGNVTPEMKNAVVTILEDDGGSDTPVGTEITCAKAVELTNALADGGTSTETYSVVGYITEVVGNVSKNQQTFWMADTKDGGRIFEAYWANLPEGVSAFTAGTKVRITGQLLKYVNATSGQVTPEIKNATVEILPDDGGSDTPVGTEITCAQAVELTNALADGGTSTETYTVTGYITEVPYDVSTSRGTPQQTFWMADTKDGGKVFEAYYANVPDGVTAFAVGMKVKITGQLKKYVNNSTGQVTPEMQNPTVVILEDDGGDTPTPGPQGDVQHITIEEFLAKADPNTTYELTGTVRNITNTTYGNFDLVEGNSSIYIYGLLDLSGAKQKFASLGIAEGDVVTLSGKYKLFNNKPEIENAQFVSVTKGQGGGDEPTPGPSGDVVTELENGGFEEWVSDAEAAGWKSASSASSATVSKSSDARSGSFSCLVKADATANKRLATQEMRLAAGTYVFSYYAKSASAADAQTRVGFVPMKDDGTVGAYKYNSEFFPINNNGWTLIQNEFTLDAESTVCLVIMNPKSNASAQYEAQDILIDDATLTKK